MSKTNSENCKVTLEELIHLFQKFVVVTHSFKYAVLWYL